MRVPSTKARWKPAKEARSRLANALYGGAAGPPRLSIQGAACLEAVTQGARSLAVTVLKTQSTCRRRIRQGMLLGDPTRCTEADSSLRARIGKSEAKLRRGFFTKCTAEELPELPACGTAAGMTSEEDAATCIIDLVHDAVDPKEVPADRPFAAPSLLEAVYPPSPLYGDGVVDQGHSARLPLGEECDGASDSQCPGRCFPPGHIFQCTCGDRPRLRMVVDGASSKVDSGWTGIGHGQAIADKAGFVVSLENCDCPQIVDGECVGTSIDPICEAHGYAVRGAHGTPARR